MKNICFRLLLSLAAFVSFAFALAAPTAAADLITLKIPGIPGDSKVSGHVGEIEVMALSDDIVNSGSIGGTGKAQFGDMMIHKRFDGSSPALFLALVSGSHLSNAVITFLHNDAGILATTFTITLTEVLVSRLAPNATERNVLAAQEQINLNYARIQLKDEVTGNQACFDVRTNTKC